MKLLCTLNCSLRTNCRSGLLLIPLIGVILAGSALADDLRIVTLTRSVHYSEDDKNDNLNGVGIEYRASDVAWLGLTSFTNSDSNKSILTSVIIEPEQSGVSYGFAMGVANNYDKGSRSMIGLTVRYEYFRALITPNVAAIGLILDF